MNDTPWYRTHKVRIALRMLAFAVLFALIGSLIGGPLAYFALYIPVILNDDSLSMSTLVRGLPYAWFGGGLFGLVPAAVTGAVAGLWRPRLRHWRIRIALAAIGAASTLLWLGLFFREMPIASFAIELLPIGVALAPLMTLAITALIVRRDARVPSPLPH